MSEDRPSARTDVLVVGGGPAGLYSAQLLARRGLSVRVLEEHARIGEPAHCTGILGTEAFALPGVPRGALVGWPRVGRFHSPAGHTLTYAGPDGEVCVIDRGVFDRDLARAAVDAGAEIMTRARAIMLEVESDGIRVRAEVAGRQRLLSARVAVLACGVNYRFQRALGWGLPPLFLASAQIEVGAVGAGDAVDLYFRPEIAPNGFAWLVPITRRGEHRAKVGVMATRCASAVLGRVVEELRRAGRLTGGASPVVARLLPLAPLSRTYGDRILAVGDAAGLVKPTTGGGIYYSLLSAGWAAETVAAAFERGHFAASGLAGYEETWRQHLGLELKVGAWFRRLAQWLTADDLDALTELAIDDGLLPLIRKTARFNWHRELIRETLLHPGVLQIVLRRFAILSSSVLEGRWDPDGPSAAQAFVPPL